MTGVRGPGESRAAAVAVEQDMFDAVVMADESCSAEPRCPRGHPPSPSASCHIFLFFNCRTYGSIHDLLMDVSGRPLWIGKVPGGNAGAGRGGAGRFHGEGYQEGYEEGSSLGIVEGRQYGTLHGAKIGSEIGCYRGFALAWKCLLHSGAGEKDSRKMKVVEALIALLQHFPYDDPTYERLHEDLDRIRGKFRQLCSLLNVQPDFKVTAEGSGLAF
ncbi:Lto1 [Phodopus roborovskii]|uniref:Lto1 protein n=1 Tax=Phodopus roborovskii TaxID=109678 RepID=A0AAU9ZP25_PHORO|nr:Lto1 [Phodopus roborovskii]